MYYLQWNQAGRAPEDEPATFDNLLDLQSACRDWYDTLKAIIKQYGSRTEVFVIMDPGKLSDMNDTALAQAIRLYFVSNPEIHSEYITCWKS